MKPAPIISVAPMMDYTDRHDRYFLRQIAPDIQLYTEMITSHALMHGDADYLLAKHATENYVALQLGGSDPKDLAKAAKLGEKHRYDEINLNVGCPSARVKSGRFGACLMLEPRLVAECVAAMKDAVALPVTVKCRIGVDDQDSETALHYFVEQIVKAGCERVIVHARKAWLQGLSPKENREIPPLCYDVVWRLKREFPGLSIVINGGIKTITQIDEQLLHVDGVMVGRIVNSHPYSLAAIQERYFTDRKSPDRFQVINNMLPYIEHELSQGTRLASMARHFLGLFYGEPGAGTWRRYLSENMHHVGAGINVLEQALQKMNEANLNLDA